MRVIKTIREKDLFAKRIRRPKTKARIRMAARAALFDQNNQIALLHVVEHDYYKLPGGGIEKGESLTEGLKREVREETGCQIGKIRSLGLTIEHRTRRNEIQKSYCYLANVKGPKGRPEFTTKEKRRGFELLWIDIDKAIKIQQGYRTDHYLGSFIRLRDLEILKEAKRLWPKIS